VERSFALADLTWDLDEDNEPREEGGQPAEGQAAEGQPAEAGGKDAAPEPDGPQD
jgi:hypothetical protein